MKNGLLVYKTNTKNNIFNIGDYIQSIAASQFFSSDINCYINRERLDKYDGDNIRLIMNGWFMHEPNHWPPNKNINPLFVAFHINSLAKKELLEEKSIAYLKQFQPIGCRDHYTAKLLNNNGVDAFFSGCLTLTLGLTYKTEIQNRSEIYFTDVFYETNKKISHLIKYTITILKKYKTINKISKKIFQNITFKNLMRTASFYQTYSSAFEDDVLINANYIQHEIYDTFESENAKFEYAKNLLNKYSEAKFVVTSRIHCALPCLSLETPVIYVENINQSEASFCRLDGLRQLFHVAQYDKGKIKCDLTSSKISTNYTFKNKDSYFTLKDNLINICNNFISK